jgi:hypothetical protein
LTVTANSTTAPDGALTADTLVEDSANSTHAAQQGSISVTSGTTYTLSCYAKPAGRNFIQLLFIGGFVTSVFAIVDITNGTVGTTAGSPTVTVANVGNGWYRISITATATSTTTTTVQLRPAASSGTGFYQGNGTSGICTWGAMVEAGAFPTSYIPTTSATVTRAADVASITGSNFSSWYNQTEGTLNAEVVSIATTVSAYPVCFEISDAGSNNWIGLSTNTFFNARVGMRAGGFSQVDMFAGTTTVGLPANVLTKYNFGYFANNAAASRNGEVASVDTVCTIPTGMTQSRIGGSVWLSQWNGTIKRLTYWPTRLANTTLQQITQP